MREKLIKWGGLLGSVITGIVMIASGDTVSGVGVIAASLSSGSLFAKQG